MILGIDPGSQLTGFGIISQQGSRLIHHQSGAWALKQFVATSDKMFYLWQQLEQLRSAYEFQEISMEKVFHGVNFKSALMLGQVRGVIFAFAGKFQLSVHEYNPTEVKKAITGYGRAEKHQMQHMVQLLLGLHQPPKPHDAADALGLAICHAHSAIPGQKS